MKIDAYRETPHRSPMAVSEAIAGLIENKLVCELGCAEGDNMVFMSRFAKEVIGVELDRARGEIAEKRGLKISYGNYRVDDLPKADVYYFWPDDGVRDDEFLVNKIYSNEDLEEVIIIVGGDTGFDPEPPMVKACAEKWGGELVEVSFNEGEGHRQSGIFLLAIIKRGLKS